MPSGQAIKVLISESSTCSFPINFASGHSVFEFLSSHNTSNKSSLSTPNYCNQFLIFNYFSRVTHHLPPGGVPSNRTDRNYSKINNKDNVGPLIKWRPSWAIWKMMGTMSTHVTDKSKHTWKFFCTANIYDGNLDCSMLICINDALRVFETFHLTFSLSLFHQSSP